MAFENEPGNPEHATVDDVVELVLKRAQHLWAEHQDGHLDEMMATVINRYGTDSVRTVIESARRNPTALGVGSSIIASSSTTTLPDRHPDLEIRNVDGVRIGTTAGQFLEELNAQDDG